MYKEHLSGYRSWPQLDHASEWILIPENMGPRLCIDETEINGDLFTIVSNPEAHGKCGSVVAMVRGTKASDVVRILLMIDETVRKEVKEVTMDFSESMQAIVTAAFPEATLVIDKFHMLNLAIEAADELRLRNKREAVADTRRKEREFNAKVKECKKRRAAWKKSHKRKHNGKKRGRKPVYTGKYKPEVLENGDTVVELLTRSKYLLSQPGNRWTEKQKARAKILFERYPKLKEAYSLVCSLRCVFDGKYDRKTGEEKLHGWYQSVTGCTVREIKAVRDTIKKREEHVLNYFINRSTNAPAESLNSKIKCFRAELRGVSDPAFFMYRVSTVLG